MSSTFNSTKITPYVYRLDNLSTGEFYIGVRLSPKNVSNLDIGYVYFTSSKIVKPRFSEFKITIIAEFFDKDSAYNFEQDLIKENFKDEKCLNGNYTNGKGITYFTSIKTEEQKIKISKTLKKYFEDPNNRKICSTGRKGKPSPNKGKSRKHTAEEIQLIREANATRIGVKNFAFTGYYHTPYGVFESAFLAARAIFLIEPSLNINRNTIGHWCKNCDIKIKYKTKKYPKFIVGTTPREHGWWFEPIQP